MIVWVKRSQIFVVCTCSLIEIMRAAKTYFFFFYSTLVLSGFHAIDHNKFVETSAHAGFSHNQFFCILFISVKGMVSFRRSNFLAQLVSVS